MVQTPESTNIASVTVAPAEQRLTLHNISWDTYEKLLEAFGEHRAARITYDTGVLEFMVPLEAHENPSDLIGAFVRTVAEESGWNLKSLASTTLKRSGLEKGAEPDKCFYIQNEALVRGKTVDLEQDPPPDLVVEVDITHTDIDKNQLYARLGVAEFWRYDGKELRIFQLQEREYEEVHISPTFTSVPKDIFYEFLQRCQQEGEVPANRALRIWVRTRQG